VTPTPSVAASAAPTAARSSAAAPPCATRALGVKTGTVQGAAGSTYLTIDFTNISGAVCSLTGYPGVALAGGKPVQQIGEAATHNPVPARQLVTLAAGKVAHVVLQLSHATNYPAAQCSPTTATYLQIYPPAQTTPVFLGYSTSACARPIHLLTVTVVQPGA
jgi:hypothetical protein